MKYEPNEALKHYGVPGMKWGVRRNRSKTAVNPAAKKKTPPQKN